MHTKQTLSGISVAIQNTMASIQMGHSLIEPSKSREFTIKIANSLQEREAVFRLAYQVYLDKKFIKPNAQEWMIQPYDADSNTIILIVQDKNKVIAGSVTLVFNGSIKLPAEKIYCSELNVLKSKGEKMVELSRLVINPVFRNSKEVLVLLFNYLAIYAYHIQNYTSLVVEVNPRHKNYYKSLLNFDEIGAEKPCPSVQNAPAVLLYLPLARYQLEVFRCANHAIQGKKEKSLYPYFLKLEQETLVVYYLKKQIKPMSQEEKYYFGFSESNCGMAIV